MALQGASGTLETLGFWDRLKRAFGPTPEPPPPPAPKRTPRQAFADFFTRHALEHPAVQRVEPDASDELVLRVWVKGKDSPSVLYLGNLLDEIRELSPQQKSERIRAFLSILDHQDDELSWDEAQEVLVPLVRPLAFAFSTPMKPLARPLLPYVSLYAGLDQGQSIRIVSTDDLERWNVPPDEVFDAAFATLANHVLESDFEPFDPEAPYPIWHVTRDDSYESSRLALPGLLESLRPKVRGNPIAVIPARSMLVVTGDADTAAVERLARLAQAEFEAAPRSISPAVYTLAASGAVQPLHLAPEHPHHHLVERGHRLLAAQCYADQKAVIEQRFEQEGVDVFVATLGLMSDKTTGATNSWATMVKGVDTLLPEADLIALGSDEGEEWHAFVPWDTVFELAPQCFEKDTRFDPPRWRVTGWPDAATVDRLRAAASF